MKILHSVSIYLIQFGFNEKLNTGRPQNERLISTHIKVSDLFGKFERYQKKTDGFNNSDRHSLHESFTQIHDGLCQYTENKTLLHTMRFNAVLYTN